MFFPTSYTLQINLNLDSNPGPVVDDNNPGNPKIVPFIVKVVVVAPQFLSFLVVTITVQERA